MPATCPTRAQRATAGSGAVARTWCTDSCPAAQNAAPPFGIVAPCTGQRRPPRSASLGRRESEGLIFQPAHAPQAARQAGALRGAQGAYCYGSLFCLWLWSTCRAPPAARGAPGAWWRADAAATRGSHLSAGLPLPGGSSNGCAVRRASVALVAVLPAPHVRGWLLCGGRSLTTRDWRFVALCS